MKEKQRENLMSLPLAYWYMHASNNGVAWSFLIFYFYCLMCTIYCFPCIVVEAKLKSKLSATNTVMFKLSNNIRLCTLRMMANNGPEYDAIAGAMLVGSP